MGLGVAGATIYRAFHLVRPAADVMGGLGVAGLVVNVAAAMVLLRFRDRGDANARAIWLFSRNDALANIAIIAAAGLTGWLNSAWPDIVTAGVIATLFIHSAMEIVGEANAELREP
jgi:Co/Zn/Cd efflux system component